jgi:hypothetical protein
MNKPCHLSRSCGEHHTVVRSAEVPARDGSVRRPPPTIVARRANTCSARMMNHWSHRLAFNRTRLRVQSAAVTERE